MCVFVYLISLSLISSFWHLAYYKYHLLKNINNLDFPKYVLIRNGKKNRNNSKQGINRSEV